VVAKDFHEHRTLNASRLITGGKAMSTTPPRNVIYYNDNSNPISLAGISGLPYTDVILAFLVPDGNFNLAGQGGAFDSEGNPHPNDIQALQNAGKNVLISVGGDIKSFSSSDWRQYAQDVNGLVDQLVGYVTANGLNGVDIDYEDDSGFTGAYDGITFLTSLTNGLAQNLPPGQNIITHAPQPPYFDPDARFNNAYTQIWEEAGSNISWFNCQFYNNPSYDAPASTKVSWYETFAGIIGAQKLLTGAPLDPATGGYLPLDEFASQVIAPLLQTFGSAFGGVMGWEFSYDQDGTWAEGTAHALADRTGTGPPTPGRRYTIRAGDTLYSIATTAFGAADAHHGVTAIEGANPGIDPDDLQIGQVIYIPVLA
jgi:chitinase